MEKMQLLFSRYVLLLYLSILTLPEKAEGYLSF